MTQQSRAGWPHTPPEHTLDQDQPDPRPWLTNHIGIRARHTSVGWTVTAQAWRDRAASETQVPYTSTMRAWVVVQPILEVPSAKTLAHLLWASAMHFSFMEAGIDGRGLDVLQVDREHGEPAWDRIDAHLIPRGDGHQLWAATRSLRMYSSTVNRPSPDGPERRLCSEQLLHRHPTTAKRLLVDLALLLEQHTH